MLGCKTVNLQPALESCISVDVKIDVSFFFCCFILAKSYPDFIYAQ